VKAESEALAVTRCLRMVNWKMVIYQYPTEQYIQIEVNPNIGR